MHDETDVSHTDRNVHNVVDVIPVFAGRTRGALGKFFRIEVAQHNPVYKRMRFEKWDEILKEYLGPTYSSAVSLALLYVVLCNCNAREYY